jgi:hypothetical protein
LHLDRLVVVAESQDGFGQSPFGVGRGDPAEGSFIGQADNGGSEDYENNSKNSFHGPESISKAEFECRALCLFKPYC